MEAAGANGGGGHGQADDVRRCRPVGHVARAELAVCVRSPALHAAGGGHGATVPKGPVAGRHGGYSVDQPHDPGRRVADGLRTVTELAVGIVAPAARGTGPGHRAGMQVTGVDGGDLPGKFADQRCVWVTRRSRVAQLAVTIEAPTIRHAVRGDRAIVVFAEPHGDNTPLQALDMHGHQACDGGSVAELSRVAAPPAEHVPASRQRTAMRFTAPDRDRGDWKALHIHWLKARGDGPITELAVVVPAPAPDPGSRNDGTRMVATGAEDLDRAGKAGNGGWHQAIGGIPDTERAMAVAAPALHGAATGQGAGVVHPGTDRLHAAAKAHHLGGCGQVRGAATPALAELVVAPAFHTSAGVQGTGVRSPRGDGHHATSKSGDAGWSGHAPPPAEHGAAHGHCAGVAGAARHLEHTFQRHVALRLQQRCCRQQQGSSQQSNGKGGERVVRVVHLSAVLGLYRRAAVPRVRAMECRSPQEGAFTLFWVVRRPPAERQPPAWAAGRVNWRNGQ